MPKLLKLPKWLRVPSPVDLGKAEYNALPMKGFGKLDENAYTWHDWREEVKMKFPVRYFLFETIPHKFTVKIKMPIGEVIYWAKCKLFKKYKFHLIDIRNLNYGHDSLSKYKYGYCDSDDQILYASFAILNKHVENGNPQKQIDFIKEEWGNNRNGYGSIECDKERLAVYEEILALYNWWNVERVLLLNQADKALFADSDKITDDVREKYKDSTEIDAQIEKEEYEALCRLAKVRKYLWY